MSHELEGTRNLVDCVAYHTDDEDANE